MADFENVKLQAALLNSVVGELRDEVMQLLSDDQAGIPHARKETLETLIQQIARYQDDLDGALGNHTGE
ncbi:hypothetical protein B0T40_10530 [Chromobacterium haemolyticum]|uniref:hypothetical protein n=1 Tax=Chromobacterium haemolyticum TaxID=394935 RepID=UPI0009D9E33C|nr:hypothetical protein [Chromobacterium haemolyticum]OQS36813.1 hypothetical protein B0T40_10530 [Chromobacterium haemolyticum]